MSADQLTSTDPQERARAAARAGAVAPAPAGAPDRVPRVAPPAARAPSAPAAVPAPTPAPPAPAAGPPSAAGAVGEDRADDGIPGTPKGSMRQITLYVSAGCAATVAEQRGPHESLGGVVMRALRDAYQALVEAHRNAAVPEPVGPFPAPERHRRRLSVPDARPLTVRVSPAEAEAIGKVAEELDTSVSCLVEDAVAWRFHRGPSDPSERPTPTAGA